MYTKWKKVMLGLCFAPFVIGFIVDITSRKEIEQNLLRQKKELEKISDDIRHLNAELEGKVEERTLILKEALQKCCPLMSRRKL